MSVKEIEIAIEGLTPQQLAEFRDWFARFDAERWDRHFEADVVAGKLNKLGEKAIFDVHHRGSADQNGDA